MKSVMALILILSVSNVMSARDEESRRDKRDDLIEQRLILLEHSNLMNDEQIEAGEFSKIAKKIDSIDEELKELQ